VTRSSRRIRHSADVIPEKSARHIAPASYSYSRPVSCLTLVVPAVASALLARSEYPV
jgi:hypothetical protein